MNHATLDTIRDTTDDGVVEESLNERRAAVTRDAIRDAVQDILVTEHPASISIPAVAERAGVSVRTVYRYFPSKAALLDDVAEAYMRRADELTEGREDLFDDPATYLKVLWRDFATDVEAVRSQHTATAGADLRAHRLQGARDGIRVRLDKAFPDTSDTDRALLTDLLVAVPSSSMFLELHDRMGHNADLAAELAVWMVGALQRQFAERGGFGSAVPSARNNADNVTPHNDTNKDDGAAT